jgi:hypothetical protein
VPDQWRVAITAEDFEAICATLPLRSVMYVDQPGAMRGPRESYSDVILRIVGR